MCRFQGELGFLEDTVLELFLGEGEGTQELGDYFRLRGWNKEGQTAQGEDGEPMPGTPEDFLGCIFLLFSTEVGPICDAHLLQVFSQKDLLK